MIPTRDHLIPEEEPERLFAPAAGYVPADRLTLSSLLSGDRALQILVALSFLIDVALFVYLLARLEALPELLPLHFDASGFPDRIEAKTGILALPAIGLIVIVLNVFFALIAYRRERGMAILLTASALLMQILLWLAVVNIVGGLM